MALNEKLQQMKAKSLARIPPEAAAIMAQATKSLKESGILENILPAGEFAPEFTLQDFNGQGYSSKDLLSGGPIVLTFYRGSW
jgi:hypothetical protein